MEEQQKLPKPLPARLQAVTHRFAKAQQLLEESEAKVEAACEALKQAKKDHEEAAEKQLAAFQELVEVKRVAGAEPVGAAEKGLATSIVAALAARNIIGPEAEALLADVLRHYMGAKAGSGCGGGVPGQAVKLPDRQKGRGRSPPKEGELPRAGSASRSPRGLKSGEQ